MDYNKYDFLPETEASTLRVILDYLVLIPIAIVSFFMITTTNVHDDLRFSLMRMIKHHPVVQLFQFPATPVVSIGVIPGQRQVLAAPAASTTVAPLITSPTPTVAKVVPSIPIITSQAATVTVPQYQQKTVVVKPKDSLARIFKRLNLDVKTATTILAVNKSIQDLRNLQKGQEIDFFFDSKNTLQKITYQPDFKTTITFTKNNNFKGNISHLIPTEKLQYSSTLVQGSLIAAARKVGIPKKIILQIISAYNSKINLSKSVVAGDKIALIAKNYYVADKKVGNSEVVAAEVMHKGKAYALISFEDSKGNTNFYTPEGYSLKTPFIRFPVKYKEISSRFSLGRYHPILGIVRPHTGVDFAANYGTPIKATSDGTISFAGTKEGLGKTVEIKHNQYATVYGHMEGFAKGIKSGQTVHQGQVIGFIGSTGLSTGPHVHYEFHINGKAYDPLKVKLPDKEMIASKYRSRFLTQAKKIMAALNGVTIASIKQKTVTHS